MLRLSFPINMGDPLNVLEPGNNLIRFGVLEKEFSCQFENRLEAD